MCAATAKSLETSAPVSAPTPSRSPDKLNERSGFSASNHAQKNGLPDTEHGWLSEPDQREARRWAYEAGVKRGAASFFQSPVMEQLSLEIALTKATLRAVSDAAIQRERLLLHWKNEAQWWRAEHDKVSAEYSNFVKQAARLLGK
jgi:hypothetical protein